MVIDMDKSKEKVRLPVDDVSGFGIGSKVVLTGNDENGKSINTELRVIGICDDETDPSLMVEPW